MNTQSPRIDVDRKDAEAAAMAWYEYSTLSDPLTSPDFVRALGAISMLNFFFEKVLGVDVAAAGLDGEGDNP